MRNIVMGLMTLLSIQVFGQSVHYVTVVSGGIFNKQTERKVQIGDKLTGNERLIFTSKEDYLIVLSPKGRFKISPEKSSKPNELITLLISENIHTHAENVRLSSRSLGEGINLSDYFKPAVENGKEINDKILIVEELKIPILKMGYSGIDNKENFFFLQLIDTSRSGVNKQLKVRNDTLFLSMDDFTFGGKPYSENDGILVLGFVEGYTKEKKVSKVATLKPTYISTKIILAIIRAIKNALATSKKDEVINEIYTELYYLYGKPDKQLIEDLLDIKND